MDASLLVLFPKYPYQSHADCDIQLGELGPASQSACSAGDACGDVETGTCPADVLCLQEVNGQPVRGQAERRLIALDQLLAGTRYAGFHRVSTTGPDGHGVADVHNLVTLSRLPLLATHEVRHSLVPPLQHSVQTAEPADTTYKPLRFDRPILVTDIDAGDGRRLSVVNLHLRAPVAATIAGQKLASFVWKTVSAWAEGYFLAAVRRAA